MMIMMMAPFAIAGGRVHGPAKDADARCAALK